MHHPPLLYLCPPTHVWVQTRNIHQLIITPSGLDPWRTQIGSDFRKHTEEAIMCCAVSSATSGYLFGQAKGSDGIPPRFQHLTADELVGKDHVSEPGLTRLTHTHTHINITPSCLESHFICVLAGRPSNNKLFVTIRPLWRCCGDGSRALKTHTCFPSGPGATTRSTWWSNFTILLLIFFCEQTRNTKVWMIM